MSENKLNNKIDSKILVEGWREAERAVGVSSSASPVTGRQLVCVRVLQLPQPACLCTANTLSTAHALPDNC